MKNKYQIKYKNILDHTASVQIRNIISILAIIIIFSGCSTFTKSTQLKNEIGLAAVEKSTATLQGGALVAIRWPAIVDDKAKLVLLQAEKNLRHYKHISDAFDPLPLASTYYAMEAYRKMTLHLQPSEVLLEPQVLTTDNYGSLHLAPLMDNKLPVAFVMDILEFKTGQKKDNWDFSPTLMVSTGAAASPLTCGIIASTKLKANTQEDDKKFYLGYTTTSNRCHQKSTRTASQIDFVINDYLSKLRDSEKKCFFTCASKGLFISDEQSKFQIRNKLPLTPNELMIFPNTWEDFSTEYMKISSQENFDSTESSLQNQTLETYAQAVAEGISKYDLSKSTESGLVKYIAIYDKELADRYSKRGSASLSEDDALKLEQIKGFADYEKTYLNRIDNKLANIILDGEFGKKFRAVRLEHYKQYQVEVASQVAMVALGAAAGAVSGMAVSSNSNMDLTAFNSATLGALMKINSDRLNSEQDFYSQFGAVLDGKERLLEVIVRGQTYNIDAKDLLSVREDMKKIYNDLFRV